jgi:hypothetical protein
VLHCRLVRVTSIQTMKGHMQIDFRLYRKAKQGMSGESLRLK